jgi:hypothetical protein
VCVCMFAYVFVVILPFEVYLSVTMGHVCATYVLCMGHVCTMCYVVCMCYVCSMCVLCM